MMPLVDDGDASLASGVRVRVHVAGGSVRGPARVPDAHGSTGFVLPDVRLQIGDFPLLFLNTQRVLALQRGNARAVIASVFEALQSVNEDGVGFLGPEVSDNSTHGERAYFG